MKIVKNMEFQSLGIIEMLKKQALDPYCQCLGIDELLREYPGCVTRQMAVMIFLLGYIEGKRADRARRNKS